MPLLIVETESVSTNTDILLQSAGQIHARAAFVVRLQMKQKTSCAQDAVSTRRPVGCHDIDTASSGLNMGMRAEEALFLSQRFAACPTKKNDRVAFRHFQYDLSGCVGHLRGIGLQR